jgi:hypothetical protein
MVIHDCEGTNVDREKLSLISQLLLNPEFAVIVVLPADFVVAHQKATPNGATSHVHDGDIGGCKNVCAS